MERKTKTIAQVIKATTKKQHFGKDFQYVVQRRGKAPICFGTSQERNKIPKTSRLAVKYLTTAAENLSPGNYFTQTLGLLDKRPTSIKGTVLGGRTAPRDSPIPEGQGPPPNKYLIPPESAGCGPAFSKMPRCKNIFKGCTVGPGYYKTTEQPKAMMFAHSFGGRKKLIPPIAMTCRPINPDTCDKCKKSPLGDYWALAPEITWEEAKKGMNAETGQKLMCRSCYENERRCPRVFNKRAIKRFQKVRGCSQVHRHDGCEARLLLMPPRVMDKIQEKEAYLSLYFY